MIEPFEDITVTRFDAGPEDQDQTYLGLFNFKFYLSRPAPALWVSIAGQTVGDGSRVNFCIQRHAWAYSDRFVVRCSVEEAQRIKDVLNSQIVPSVNQFYRQEAATRSTREDAFNREQEARFDAVAEVIRKQK